MLNFQIGKKYRRRNGSIVKAIGIKFYMDTDNTVQFDDYDNTVWAKNGRVSQLGETPYDIIEEVKDDEMKIEVGKQYKTYNGYKAYIFVRLPDSAAAVCRYLGYITSPDGVFCCQTSWNEEGKSSVKSYEIVEEWKEPKSGVLYANILVDKSNGTPGVLWFNNKEEADKSSNYSWADRVACIRVEWKEGQFDE